MNTCESSTNLSKIEDASIYMHARQEIVDEWLDMRIIYSDQDPLNSKSIHSIFYIILPTHVL